MTYNINLIKNIDYTPTYWSGGMASELITYPIDSSFANRDFLWRIGCAKIDIDTSIFSNLPSIKKTPYGNRWRNDINSQRKVF